MPAVLRLVDIGAGEQHPELALFGAEFQTFWPVTTHSSPSRTARAPTLARSDPDPGSLNSWHHAASPRAIGGTNASICSAVPWSRIVGAASPAAT